MTLRTVVSKLVKAAVVLVLGLFCLSLYLNLHKRLFSESERPLGQPREAWLATFKQIETEHLCGDSPFRDTFSPNREQCTTVVGGLFDWCANDVKNVSVPATLTSREEAERVGATIGECIVAYAKGGEHLDRFNEMQRR